MSTARRAAGATENSIDQSVRDAIADLQTFWTDAYPRFYDRPPMDPQEGGDPCDVGI
jgi:hypothetical protein